MNFFTKLSNGWQITMNSFAVLKENKQLILFPILSGISLVLVLGSFITAIMASAGWDTDNLQDKSTALQYFILFLFYVVNYFIILFFNMALVHCTHLYFTGQPVSLSAGIRYSLSRIGAIFSWAIFAATVGLILRIIQENFGWLGKLIAGVLGIVWSIATFFVVPIIAYENAGPIDAFRRSGELMKQKWGESLASTFSLGFIQLIGILVVALPLYFLGSLFHPLFGILLAVLGGLLVVAVISATQMIFVSAVYHNIQGNPVKHFNQQLADNLFVHK